MHRHVLAAQKARIDSSIRDAAAARYQKVGPDDQSCTSGLVPVIIEVPRGQRNKLEFDKETGTLQLDRVLHSTCFYPGDYGFVPRTLCPDGDPIDVLVLSKFPLAPGCLVYCRIVGVMDMEDEKGGDAKLIAVVATEPRTLSITDIEHVPSHIKAEIQQFFELYKALEAAPGKPKWVKIRSWGNRARALQDLTDSIALYKRDHADGEGDRALEVGNVYELSPEACLCTSAPGVVTAYIEVQKSDANKYEWDHDTGFLTLDRVLHSSLFYPGDYGFIPRTLGGDGDPIDVLVLSTFSLSPGTLCDVRIVGALNMDDEKGEDQKLLAVVATDPRFDEVQDLGDVEGHLMREIAQFFEMYKELENPSATPALAPGMAGLPPPPPSPLASPMLRGGSAEVEPMRRDSTAGSRKKTKFARIKGWLDRAGALALLEQAKLNYKPSPGGMGLFPKMRRLHIGDKSPSIVNCIIRAPKNTTVRYDVLPKIGLLKVEKVLHSAITYPGDYGSIPQTMAEDGKPVDCISLSVFPLPLGCVAQLRVVALLDLEDQNGPNSKVVAVPDEEPRLLEYRDLDSIPVHVQKECAEFFNTYKNLEGAGYWARVTGWRPRQAALDRITASRERFFSFGSRMEDLEEREQVVEQRLKEVEAREAAMAARLSALEAARS